MKNLKQKLFEEVTIKPDVLQFAKDRKYEESWIIPISKSRPDTETIDTYLIKEKYNTLIVEYIWNSEDDDHRFVLTLFLDKNCQLQDPKKFIDVCLDNFFDYRDMNSFIQNIDAQIIGKEYLFTDTIDSVNISVFNHWLSVGPTELWKKDDMYDFEIVKSKIYARPEIEKTPLNYQGLLFRFNVDGSAHGPYYGIKTPCYNKMGREWTIDFEKIDYWMRLMLG